MHKNMKKWHAVCATLCLSLAPTASNAQVYDFEDCEIGQKFTMWNVDAGNVTDASVAEAVVAADPTNPNNKVLHVTVKQWGTLFTLTLPKNWQDTC